MKETKAKRILLYIASFALPVLIIIAALRAIGIAPFGDHTLLISDGDGLYINFLSYVGRAVRGLENITYSFEKGIGGNMMDSWGWFLLNPFFPLFSLFDITGYPTAYTYISVLNFSICGLTMYILLKDIYGHKLSNIIFSTSYALNGFLVANVFQMNFFTGVCVLPLMALGIRRILQNRNPIIYIFSLGYSLFTNFYFGFMLCVASALIFTVSFFMDEIENKKYVAIKYIISSVLAGLISAVIWLPALLALRGGRLNQSIISEISLQENMPFLEIFSKLFTGANTISELTDGLPNIFVGILPVALVILFFLNQKIERRKKVKAAILLGIYLLSFYIVVLDILMHGGTVTNWFNFRYSFIFSFLLLMIAAQEWEQLGNESTSTIKKAGAILLVTTVVIFLRSYEFVNGSEVVIDYIILSVMMLAFWMHRKDPMKNTKLTFELIVIVLVSVNLFMNYWICTKNILKWESTVSEYLEAVMPVSSSVDAIKATDGEFYRMEIGEQRKEMIGNDPMLYGYYGVSHGGSDDKDATRQVLSQLGIHRYDMRTYYNEGIPAATDTLLGLRYIISKENLTEEKGYEMLPGIFDWRIYKNNNALPIAMLSDSSIQNVELDFEDLFENLNTSWMALAGKDEKVFIEEQGEIIFSSHNYIDPVDISSDVAKEIVSKRDAGFDKTSNNVSDSEQESLEKNAQIQNDSGVQFGSLKEPPENSSYIQYSWSATQDGPVYTYNRSGMVDDIGSLGTVLNYEGYYHKGDTVTGYLPVSGYVTQYLLEEVAGRFKAAYADLDALESLSNEIRNRPTTIEKVKDSELCGEFTAEEGQILMLTIPYDDGWTLRVDGEETVINKALNVFMIANVDEGHHTYELIFVPSGIVIAERITICCILLTGLFMFYDWRKKIR